MVDMAAQHRNGNASRHKTKRAELQPRPSQKMLRKQLLHALCRCCHVNAGQLEGLAVNGAFYGHVMTRMCRHLGATYTFLSSSFTNTYFAPCSLTHLVVHSPWPSFAPLAPHC